MWNIRTSGTDLRSRNDCPLLYVNTGYKTPKGQGKNPCILGNKGKTKDGIKMPFSGSVLPNCVGYVVGRTSEGCGETSCHLNSMDAYKFWTSQPSGWTKTQIPSVGAVAVWGKGTGSAYGHVAVVERVESNSVVWISESNWSVGFFKYEKINPANRWRTIPFKGYLTNPYVTQPTVDSWIYKTEYYQMSDNDMLNNATLIYEKLKRYGMSTNAICAILGNIYTESWYNPHTFEYSSKTYSSGGYGLIQWTPGNHLKEEAQSINRNDFTTGDCQTEVIYRELDGTITGEYFHTTAYGDYTYLPQSQFIISTLSPETLCECYCFSRERPDASAMKLAERKQWARKWFDYFTEHPTPVPPTPEIIKPIDPDKGAYLDTYSMTEKCVFYPNKPKRFMKFLK